MSEPTPQRDVALAVATLAVTAWAFGPIFVRSAGASTPTVVFWRLWLAQPVMIATAMLNGGRLSFPLLRRAVVPGLMFALSIMTNFASFHHTSIANATIIGALQPAALLLVAPVMFGLRAGRRQVVLTMVALAGTATVVLAAGATSGARLEGDLYALANLVIWTAYFIRIKRLRDEGIHAPTLLASILIVAALAVTPWALLTSPDLTSMSVGGYGWVLLMVLGPGLIGHGSMTWAQRHLDITVASLLTLLNPVFATILAWVVYGEELNGVQLLGAAVVLVALTMIVASVRQRPVAPPNTQVEAVAAAD